jgi:hypothetical protein
MVTAGHRSAVMVKSEETRLRYLAEVCCFVEPVFGAYAVSWLPRRDEATGLTPIESIKMGATVLAALRHARTSEKAGRAP